MSVLRRRRRDASQVVGEAAEVVVAAGVPVERAVLLDLEGDAAVGGDGHAPALLGAVVLGGGPRRPDEPRIWGGRLARISGRDEGRDGGVAFGGDRFFHVFGCD